MATVADLYDVPEVFPELADLDLSSRVDNYKYAIYYTASISQQELNAAVAAINSSSDDNAQLAPHADFTGKHLRDVLEHHKDAIVADSAELADYDPFSIIVLGHTDWRANGVLLVSLHNVQGSGRGYVFAFPHPAHDAALTLVNIDIGNDSWEEACDTMGVDIPEPPAFMNVSGPPGIDRWIENNVGRIDWYTLYQVTNAIRLTEALNGGPEYWDRPHDEFLSCPFHASVYANQIQKSLDPNASKDEKIAEIFAQHQERRQRSMATDPTLGEDQFCHARFIVITDHEDYEAQGVLVAEITEDGSDIITERTEVSKAVDVLLAKLLGDEVVDEDTD